LFQTPYEQVHESHFIRPWEIEIVEETEPEFANEIIGAQKKRSYHWLDDSIRSHSFQECHQEIRRLFSGWARDKIGKQRRKAAIGKHIKVPFGSYFGKILLNVPNQYSDLPPFPVNCSHYCIGVRCPMKH
jgi:hypothetical protein